MNLYPFAGADECLALAGHRVSVPAIAFSPDGSRLVSVAKDQTVALWDSASGQRNWEGDRLLPSPGQAVAFCPEGKLVATGDWDTHLIQLWDAASGRQLLQLTDAPWPQTWTLQFVPDSESGLRLVRGSDGVATWQIGSAREVLDHGIEAVRFVGSRWLDMRTGVVTAPDGKRVAFISGGTTIVQDLLAEQPSLTLAPNTSAGSVQPVAFSPDGGTLAVLLSENRVAVFDATTGELRRSFAVTGPNPDGRQLVLSHTGHWLAVTSGSMRGVEIHDFATGELRYTLPDRVGTVYWLAWHPKEPRLAIARDNGDIAIWDLAKIDRQLADLGLGFAPDPSEVPPTKDNR